MINWNNDKNRHRYGYIIMGATILLAASAVLSVLDYLNGNSYFPWGVGTLFFHIGVHGGLAYWSNRSFSKMWGTWFGWTITVDPERVVENKHEIEEWLEKNILPNRWIKNYNIYVFLLKSDATHFKITWT